MVYLRVPDFFSQLINEISSNQQRKEFLSGVNITRSFDRIHRFLVKQEQYKNPYLSLDIVAENLDLNSNAVAQLINDKLGVTFNTYLSEIRVKKAITLLKKEKDLTAAVVGTEVGYNSNTAFYNAFKRVTGKSPRDYR